MKSLTDIVRGCVDNGARPPGDSDIPRAKDQTGQSVGHLKKVAEKGLWQDVEFVPKIVEKIGG